MKSEERHRLKENELEHLAAKMRPFAEKYGLAIAGGLVAILVIWGAIHLWRASAQKKAAASWGKLLNSTTVDEYEETAEDFESTAAGKWARLEQARRYLRSGVQSSFSNRSEAKKELEKAKEAYNQVLDSNPPSALRERALYGLACTLESLGGDDTAEAVKVYKQLLVDFDSTLYKTIVEEKIKELEKADTKDFYAWYAKQNPKPSDRERPQDGAAGLDATPAPEIPDLLQMDGTDGDEEFLETLPETTPEETPGSPEAPGTPETPEAPGTPEKTDEKKTEEEKTEETPKTPKNSEENKSEKPAENTPEQPEKKTPAENTPEKPAETPAPEKPAENNS